MTPAATSGTGRTVRLVPLLRLHHLGDRRFDYLVPPQLDQRVILGSIVRVPFGNRSVRAVVVEEVESAETAGPATPLATADARVRLAGDASRGREGLRLIEAVAEEAVPPELLQLAEEMARRYLSSYESCLRLMIPPVFSGKTSVSGGRRLTWVKPTQGDTALQAGLADAAGPPGGGGSESAAEGGPGSEDAPGSAGPEGGRRLTPKQQEMLDSVPPGGLPAAVACEAAGVGRGVLRALVDKGLLVMCEAPAPEQPSPAGSGGSTASFGSTGPPELWPEQQAVLQNLRTAYETSEVGHRVLWGVTGSGKTEIYLRLIERALEDGGGVILLVPEIALTPQMIARVKGRFGNRVGVLHSGLPKAERGREYRRVASGSAPVVVGARSAVFAPVPSLRLIIIDESHDGSYKQEEEPRYHATTVAQMRLRDTGGLLLEGTATPAVESMGDESIRLRLTRKAVGVAPALEVVDMRRQGGGELLSARSRHTLAETLRRGEQAIVLLNRRGFAAHVHCDTCGHVLKCADCELSLTYHSASRRLVCHHCARVYFQPSRCPACGGPPLTRGAPGTERLDLELRAMVPQELVFRMDSDVVTGAARAHEILAAFAASSPGVLIGTQMVAKGHDFPEVTLVVVADADTGLYVPDFRAAERTFQLLTQVAGRAGRAEKPGKVLVQTWNPDVPCIRMALQRDEQGFYADELRTREHLGYPPFSEIVRLMTLSEDADKASAAARYLTERLAPHFATNELRGPARLPTLRGRERWHLLVSSSDGERVRAIVGEALSQLTGPYRRRGVTLLADVDPLSFG